MFFNNVNNYITLKEKKNHFKNIYLNFVIE